MLRSENSSCSIRKSMLLYTISSEQFSTSNSHMPMTGRQFIC